MSYKNIMFRGFVASLKKVFPLRAMALLAGEEIAPVMSLETRWGKVRFLALGRLPLMRIETFHSKEPDTLEWVDKFEDGSVLWDVGANVGTYSLYAALRANIKVVAFEAAAQNYALLNRNIELNKLDNVYAFCTALSDTSEFGFLYMGLGDEGSVCGVPGKATGIPGRAGCSFGKPISPIGKPFKTDFKQAMISFAIDDLIGNFRLPFPNYLKIDVDGNEGKILEGARETISDGRMRSILVELFPERPDYERIVSLVLASGFKLESISDRVEHIFRRA